MKREIKFRAWTAQSFDDNDKPVFEMIYPDRLAISEYDLLVNQLKSTDRCMFMQFTGLTDKNKVEIYDGDIIKSDYMNRLFVIVWYYNGWAMKWVKTDDHAHIYGLNVKVIGNIYENPELLHD